MRKLEPIARLKIRRPNMVKRGLTYSKQNLDHMLPTTRNRIEAYRITTTIAPIDDVFQFIAVFIYLYGLSML